MKAFSRVADGALNEELKLPGLGELEGEVLGHDEKRDLPSSGAPSAARLPSRVWLRSRKRVLDRPAGARFDRRCRPGHSPSP